MVAQSDISILKKMADTLRCLCADMVQEANSGHPGVAMGLSDIATTLSLHLKLNPKNPTWINRDRLVFSGGHASSLVYALLHLWGFDVSLEDLKAFRRKDSKTPGHPEYGHTQGVEITTGPLGQGVANAVGFAMGAKYAQNQFAKGVISHKVYCLCGDGDLQEGISYEACSLAGHHGLDNLILIYDSNNITIEGEVDIAMSESIAQRFLAQGWEVLECDGHDFIDIDAKITLAKRSIKPTIIIAHTIIGKGAVGLEGSHKVHGAPLGQSALEKSKAALGFDANAKFVIPEDVLLRFRNVGEKGECANKIWTDENKDSLGELEGWLARDFSKIEYPSFGMGEKIATRVSNGKILQAIAARVKGFLGGSADLAPSNNTALDSEDFPKGKNLHFGIREHAMGAITNGLANYGLYLPFCATFFVFSDYLAPSIRIASIMNAKVFYVFTHDSIGVGEDGATHQPIEQLSHFRAMPNLKVFRPADANENIACWKVALEAKGPCMFVLSRQNLEVCTPANNTITQGAYILKSSPNASLTLLASGSEVGLALKSAEILESEGIATQVVSVPCLDILLEQGERAWGELFGSSKILAIEASRSLEWYRLADDVVMMEGFGSSGKGEELFEAYGFSEANITRRARALLER